MATVTISYPGNLALQTEVWTLTTTEANKAAEYLATSPGSYWEATLVKPYRRAKRAKMTIFRIYTAGFSTGELNNALYASGSTITREP